MRYLRNLNIEDETPVMPTEKLLKQMEKQGYIVKERDHVADEARHDFFLGPRGKVEVGKEGAMDLVRNVAPSFLCPVVADEEGIWRGLGTGIKEAR